MINAVKCLTVTYVKAFVGIPANVANMSASRTDVILTIPRYETNSHNTSVTFVMDILNLSLRFLMPDKLLNHIY